MKGFDCRFVRPSFSLVTYRFFNDDQLRRTHCWLKKLGLHSRFEGFCDLPAIEGMGKEAYEPTVVVNEKATRYGSGVLLAGRREKLAGQLRPDRL